jgi:hypothetical protein
MGARQLFKNSVNAPFQKSIIAYSESNRENEMSFFLFLKMFQTWNGSHLEAAPRDFHHPLHDIDSMDDDKTDCTDPRSIDIRPDKKL